ncbi:MAG: hypothetical protein ACKO7D_03435 [Bacteroidota bacterium]
MKTKKIIWVFITGLFILSSCGGSVKGKWSEDDKQKFRNEMKNVKELSNFGKNKEKWIECYLSRCEANYSSFSEADQDEKGVEKIAVECTNFILENGSIKGKWSEDDKKKFREQMNKIEELAVLGENKNNWIECYLSKCESNYSSYHKADQDVVGVKKIAEACSDEFLKL